MSFYKTLLLILFFILPLTHGRVFESIGINFSLLVDGNFEFFKSQVFIIISSLIAISYIIEIFFKKLELPKLNTIEKVILGVICISTIFSLSPFISFVGDLEKGHTFLLYSHLLILFYILRQHEQEFLQKLLLTSLASGIICISVALKEFIFPSFNYGDLGNRLLGTFGHPNYLAGYLLVLFPSLSLIKNTILKTFLGLFLSVTILLTGSVWAIFLVFSYIIVSLQRIYFREKKAYIFGGILFGLLALSVIIFNYFPEKFHSFVSRWYIWEITLSIMFSDLKIFFIGAGAETLPYLFESFKVSEMYIFEKFGFTADRPHNFVLNTFYHFGILGLSILGFLLYRFYRTFNSNFISFGIVLFLAFGIFHYFSIATLILLSLYCAYIYKDTIGKQDIISLKKSYIFGIFIIFFSLFSVFVSSSLLRSEVYAKKESYFEANEIFSHPRYLRNIGKLSEAKKLEGFESSISIKYEIVLGNTLEESCKKLLSNYPSTENAFFCGNIFWDRGDRELAKEYYIIGLGILPDLWNKHSKYWNNYFIANTITGNRFFSEKYGDIRKVLQRVGISYNK